MFYKCDFRIAKINEVEIVDNSNALYVTCTDIGRKIVGEDGPEEPETELFQVLIGLRGVYTPE